jgi:hypothetical protein
MSSKVPATLPSPRCIEPSNTPKCGVFIGEKLPERHLRLPMYVAAFLAGSCKRNGLIDARIPSRLKTPGMRARGRRKRRDGFTDKSHRPAAGIKTDPMKRITATAITENDALVAIAHSPSEGQRASYSSTLSSSFLRPQSAAACKKAKTTGCGFFSVDDNCG